MSEFELKCLLIVLALSVIAIIFWVLSFAIYKNDQTQKTKVIIYKVVALVLVLCGLCVLSYGTYVREKDKRKTQEFVNKVYSDYIENYDPNDLGLYKCPECGRAAMAGRTHDCEA